jgi:transcriptional regulator with XRE-family HTH domain
MAGLNAVRFSGLIDDFVDNSMFSGYDARIPPGSSPMLASTSSPNAGTRLRAERERLRLSSRDVERLSYEIALARRDMRYYVSHSWVTDIERGKFRPSVLKLRTLSLIYHCNYDEFLTLFDIPIGEAAREGAELQLPHTHLLDSRESM